MEKVVSIGRNGKFEPDEIVSKVTDLGEIFIGLVQEIPHGMRPLQVIAVAGIIADGGLVPRVEIVVRVERPRPIVILATPARRREFPLQPFTRLRQELLELKNSIKKFQKNSKKIPKKSKKKIPKKNSKNNSKNNSKKNSKKIPKKNFKKYS